MKRAIVLSGGGSRGAYELGVWTALRENHIDYQLVTGASIGALNGALMAQGGLGTHKRVMAHADHRYGDGGRNQSWGVD